MSKRQSTFIYPLVGLLGALCLGTFCRAEYEVYYDFHHGMKYGVRITPGDSKSPPRAIVLEFNKARQSYDFVRQVTLQNRYLPGETIVTDDGRYIVTIDNIGLGQNEAAVTFLDLKTNKRKSVALNDIYPTNELRRKHTVGPVGTLDWVGRPPFHLDAQSKRIYVNGVNRDDEYSPSTILVDIVAMTAKISDPPFWKRKLDRQRVTFDRIRDRLEKFLSLDQYHLLERLAETEREPVVQHRWHDAEYLFRFQPGDHSRKTRVQLMRLNPKSMGFDLVKTITLKNPVAPALWVVAPSRKYMLTFDEFDKVGVTRNTVVIYKVDSGESRAFALEDFCSAADLANMISKDNVRLWRLWNPWITLANSGGWEYESQKRELTGLVPHLVADLDKMEVRLAAPFRRATKQVKGQR